MDGKRLKQLRTDRRESQETFASNAGVSKGTIQNIESGRVQPSDKVLHGIAKHLNTSINDLIVALSDKREIVIRSMADVTNLIDKAKADGKSLEDYLRQMFAH